MKSQLLTLVVLAAYSPFVHGRSVHFDISQNGNVELDIDLEEEANVEGVASQRRGYQDSQQYSTPLVADEYQVDLGYEIHTGFLTETENGKFITFKNIPYADPPVGDLRWQPPQWPSFLESKPVNNGSKGHICPQFQAGWFAAAYNFTEDIFEPGLLAPKWQNKINVDGYRDWWYKAPELDPRSSEDCLFLDVHVPLSVWNARDQRRIHAAPLVFVHGGGFIYGWKDQHGSPEARGLFKAASEQEDSDNIIHIAMNYRLGAFGWLGGYKFMDDWGTPNVGLEDQKLAMSWVYEYIHLFGGERARMTVMGQSAGASSILHHLAAGGGNTYYRPKFAKAILQSAAFFPQPNDTLNDLTYSRFLNLTGAPNLDEMSKLDTDVLMKVNAEMTFNSTYGLFAFGPTIDGNVVRDLPGRELRNGRYHGGISVLLGHEKYDGLIFTPPWIRSNDLLRTHVKELFPTVNNSVLDFVDKTYDVSGAPNNDAKRKLLRAADFLDDIAVQCNTYYLTKAKLEDNRYYSGYNAIYRFVFNIFPAIHGHDTAYTYYPSENEKLDLKPNEAAARYWQSAIANFTRYNDPGAGEDSDIWTQYTKDSKRVMNVGDPDQWAFVNNKYSMGPDDVKADVCDYWSSAPYYYTGSAVQDVRLVDQTKLYPGDL